MHNLANNNCPRNADERNECCDCKTGTPTLFWEGHPVKMTGEFRRPLDKELFLEPADRMRPDRILQCQEPEFTPNGRRLIVVRDMRT